jgi:hypothetical protein
MGTLIPIFLSVCSFRPLQNALQLGAFVLWRSFSAALLWQTKGMPNQQLTFVSCWFMNEGLTMEEKRIALIPKWHFGVRLGMEMWLIL